MDRQACLALDEADPLRTLADHFDVPDGVIYLDGNSLGVLPRSTAVRIADVVTREWGTDLIRSWNTAGWVDLPQRIGDKIARLIGAEPGQVVAADSTSLNLYKVLTVALDLAEASAADEGGGARRVVISERSNFPTDLYIAQSIVARRGLELRLVDSPADIPAALTDEVAVLMLTEVNYRTGERHDMAALTAAAHQAGVLTIWDLAHSAGAVPVDLLGADADFAIGCGYKYLNGGPGAPAFAWVHPRYAGRFRQPLSGWLGHAAPFAFDTAYEPADGISRYVCGTPPILSLSALECGVDAVLAAEPLGGMAALRVKSLALTDLFIALVDELPAELGVAVVTPRDRERRGSQVSLTLAPPRHEAAYAVVQALIARGVIGDFRAGVPGDLDAHPHIMRFGFTPLYLSFTQVFDAVAHLREVLETQEWQQERYAVKGAVT
ncbi:MAG TPA: kynureninase [Dermatophilaceae bacterium]|nr:kynureninase [Dermatophilaceae bacterium]